MFEGSIFLRVQWKYWYWVPYIGLQASIWWRKQVSDKSSDTGSPILCPKQVEGSASGSSEQPDPEANLPSGESAASSGSVPEVPGHRQRRESNGFEIILNDGHFPPLSDKCKANLVYEIILGEKVYNDFKKRNAFLL